MEVYYYYYYYVRLVRAINPEQAQKAIITFLFIALFLVLYLYIKSIYNKTRSVYQAMILKGSNPRIYSAFKNEWRYQKAQKKASLVCWNELSKAFQDYKNIKNGP